MLRSWHIPYGLDGSRRTEVGTQPQPTVTLGKTHPWANPWRSVNLRGVSAIRDEKVAQSPCAQSTHGRFYAASVSVVCSQTTRPALFPAGLPELRK